MKKFTEKQLMAIELLSRKEYESITFDDIAKEVGCSRSVLFNWQKDPSFKGAISKRSLELIKDLAPMIYKTTADLLQSKDDRVRSKGIDIYLKAMDKTDEIDKEDQKEEVDIETFIEQLDIFPSLAKCSGDYKKYYKACYEDALNSLDVALYRVMKYSRALELTAAKQYISKKEGEKIERILEDYSASESDRLRTLESVKDLLEIENSKDVEGI